VRAAVIAALRAPAAEEPVTIEAPAADEAKPAAKKPRARRKPAAKQDAGGGEQDAATKPRRSRAKKP
jgi:hypothetical protein